MALAFHLNLVKNEANLLLGPDSPFRHGILRSVETNLKINFSALKALMLLADIPAKHPAEVIDCS